MYVDNVRDSIKKLSEEEFEEYVKVLRVVMKEDGKNIRPGTLRKRVENFSKGSETVIESFESYLATFDRLAVGGGLDALRGQKIRMPKTWRQILLKVTSDQPLPPVIRTHVEDEKIARELKGLFVNSVEYCKDEGKVEFYDNLCHFNDFLKIASKK
ncbi:hypothetical protein DXT76_01215 [Halobacillus trueperi]|uniref:Uncharacterized protein n=1 Tax=Halobacillus trueperi TaxID=156205 RepID=A0A3D8VTK0_9BACI|nr:hypothetical protein [Halobacillus trueperi]RDY72587.1 hypothetical protein DXT76_01215 [Halobacillus trueperi]